MKRLRSQCVCVLVCCLAVFITAPIATGAEKYWPKFEEWDKVRKPYDDPSPGLKLYGPKQIMPAEDYAKACYNIDAMKAKWAEVVGFKSPDVVGKIAPEIKPGKYTYQDKDKYPGLKILMIPTQYEKMFNAGKPPLGNCIPEFEVVPTHQVYLSLPLAEAILRNKGKTKQDAQGFLIGASEYAIPFPRPSGPERIKAMQVLYNILYPHRGCDSISYIFHLVTWDKNLKEDFTGRVVQWYTNLSGRVTDPPLGYIDERAKKMQEWGSTILVYVAPRDQYGTVILRNDSMMHPTQFWVYSSLLRRVRKLSGTDAQDTNAGTNVIFDDWFGFGRRLSPTVFPYEYKIIAEREYLVPCFTTEGSEYVTSKEREYRNMRFERRPLYVIELIQKDPNYIYKRSILYIDQETFNLHWVDNYDKRDRLWRSVGNFWGFYPELGVIYIYLYPNFDFLIPQSGTALAVPRTPIKWPTRDWFSIGNMSRIGK